MNGKIPGRIQAMLEAIHPAQHDIAETIKALHGENAAAAYVDLADYLMAYRQMDNTVTNLFVLVGKIDQPVAPVLTVLTAVYKLKTQQMVHMFCVANARRYDLSESASEAVQKFAVRHIERLDDILLEIAKMGLPDDKDTD